MFGRRVLQVRRLMEWSSGGLGPFWESSRKRVLVTKCRFKRLGRIRRRKYRRREGGGENYGKGIVWAQEGAGIEGFRQARVCIEDYPRTGNPLVEQFELALDTGSDPREPETIYAPERVPTRPARRRRLCRRDRQFRCCSGNPPLPLEWDYSKLPNGKHFTNAGPIIDPFLNDGGLK